MNILCVCRQGRIRSVAAARVLREMGHSAVSCSPRNQRAIEVAAHLADVIFVVDVPSDLAPWVREVCDKAKGRAKVRVLKTGRDVWGDSGHPVLIARLKELFKQCVDLHPKRQGEDYTDERYCEHCDTYTEHEIHCSGHERDSSNDWRKCNECETLTRGF